VRYCLYDRSPKISAVNAKGEEVFLFFPFVCKVVDREISYLKKLAKLNDTWYNVIV
jgi:hypothetical protein